jgi:hypothetical protein
MPSLPPHTPGPWRAVAGGFVQAPREHAVDPTQNHDLDIARVYGDELFFAGQHKANASLIAAAPDMYDVLRAVVDINGSTRGARGVLDELKHRARAVLARIER